MDMDGVVDAGCDQCTNGVPPTGGSSWNPWQEDYDQDGLGDACDPCPFQKQPLGAPCTGLPIELPATRKMDRSSHNHKAVRTANLRERAFRPDAPKRAA